MVMIEMKRPENCKECPFYFRETYCYIDGREINGKESGNRPDGCGLIEVEETTVPVRNHVSWFEKTYWVEKGST